MAGSQLCLPPEPVCKLFHLDEDVQDYVFSFFDRAGDGVYASNLNDAGFTFEQIAELIEYDMEDVSVEPAC